MAERAQGRGQRLPEVFERIVGLSHLPEYLAAECGECGIAGHHGQILLKRLRRDQAVERVAVVTGEQTGAQGMSLA